MREDNYENAVDEQAKKSTCRDECCDDFRDGFTAGSKSERSSIADELDKILVETDVGLRLAAIERYIVMELRGGSGGQ